MSADNYLFVDKKNFEVWCCVASELVRTEEKGMENQKSFLIGKGKDLEEAIKIAEKANDWTIEYGIHFELWCK